MNVSVSARRLTADLGDWRTGGAAYLALADRVRLMLIDGRLASGSRLPAERELSGALQVSRTTVAAAYSQLRRAGYLRSIRGSGSTLSLPDGRRPGAAADAHVALDFTKAAASAYPGVQQAYEEATAELPGYLGHHGFDMEGLPALRQALADYYTRRGAPTRANQILVTVGAQHALSLLTHTLYSPGERVLIEHPTYPHAIDTFHGLGARLVAMPVTAEGGWDLDEGSALIRQAAPSLGFVIPDFHNPTGASMPPADRERLVAAAQRESMTLIVDETTAEIDLGRGSLPPMAARSASVVTIGSLGKIAWGGMRIGWIRGSVDLIAQVQRTRPSLDLGTPVLEQLAASKLIGQMDTMRAYRRAHLSVGRDLLYQAVTETFGHWQVQLPTGGMSLWINMGEDSSSALCLAARQDSLALVPGPRFGLQGAFEGFLRIPYTAAPEDLSAAVEILKNAHDRLGRKGRIGVAGSRLAPVREQVHEAVV